MILKPSVALLTSALVLTAARADGDAPSMTAKAGTSVCHVQQATLASGEVEVRLCVKQGSFSHDEYSVTLGESAVLKAIDDETSRGVEGSYQGKPISLRCEAKLRVPETASPGLVGALEKKGLSHADAEKTVLHMETVEVGRLCVIREGTRELVKVLVEFK
jgi:hypothetical protein